MYCLVGLKCVCNIVGDGSPVPFQPNCADAYIINDEKIEDKSQRSIMSIFDVFEKIKSENNSAPAGQPEYIIVGLGNPGEQ